MTRLHDAFDRLTQERPRRGAATILAAAQHQARRDATRRRVAAAGLVAVSASTLIALGVWALQGDAGTSVDAGPATPGLTQPAATPRTRVEVFFTPSGDGGDCSGTRAVERTVESPRVLEGALKELLRGPTSTEQDNGLTSWFDSATADALRSVKITDGVARVDFDDFSGTIPNASTACGSAMLLSQLDRTATQFPTVDQAIYSFEGDVDAFYNWLQRSPPNHTTYPDSSS